jgi:hypothetical protein
MFFPIPTKKNQIFSKFINDEQVMHDKSKSRNSKVNGLKANFTYISGPKSVTEIYR